MESINYAIQKLSDTFLIPAVALTFIALIYFTYKWSRKNLSNRPFSVFNIFYIETDEKCELEKSDVIIEQNLPVTVFRPTILSTATLTELRNKSRSIRSVPLKMNRMLKKEIAKLHTSSLFRKENVYTYPVYKVWRDSQSFKDSTDIIKENEPLWDYYDMRFLPPDPSLKENDFIYRTVDGNFAYKDNNDDADGIETDFSSETSLFYVKDFGSTFEAINQYKKPLAEYYRICYDIDNLYGFNFDEMPTNKDNTKNLKESESVNAEKDNCPSPNKNLLDKSQFISVDLNSNDNSEELFIKEYPTTYFEKHMSKRENYENYWDIV